MPASVENHASEFGLYVHWPFCLSKCPYCDFNSHVKTNVDVSSFSKALVVEMRALANRITKRPKLASVFFGGGTPSLMPAAAVQDILSAASEIFGFSDSIEITLEANPTSADAERFRAYAGAGVNRLSLGVQALNDADLKFLGRLHTVQEALSALHIARSVFDRVSFDLIYARPNQTLASWQAELEQALSFGCDHHSLYQLTFEEGTPFHAALTRGLMTELEPELAAELYEYTQLRMYEAGLPAYEISNHARKGQESQHNLIYWRYGDYLGVGPGAHSRLKAHSQRYAAETDRDPARWLESVQTQGHGLAKWEVISPDQQFTEALLMGMRLAEGVDMAFLERLYDTRIESRKLETLSAQGFLEIKNGRLTATAKGRPVLNAVLRELLA